MIDRNIEEALNLLRVQIHREDPVRTRRNEKIGDEFCGDGNPRLVFAILSSVAIKWHDRRDPVGRCAARGIDHDEQLHQMMVRRRAGGLNDEDILSADVLVDFNEGFSVRETRHRGLSQGHTYRGADLFSQRPVGIAREYF